MVKFVLCNIKLKLHLQKLNLWISLWYEFSIFFVVENSI